ncbi:zinc finger protein 11-like isoform X2 [Cloeon dipterum]|uniref:zinc finger protein 11-like isoform X2 n=1 Tax=Cloeon dipterum TaxID=197152 RepID=UPI00321FA149
MKLRGKEEKTPIQKPLCRLCECPTSDGYVLASQVDRFKLRKWAMEVMNLTEEDENLPDVVEEDALICYFCIWQAEFGDESGDEAVAWWPKNLDLEENAKVLRENYSVGEVEQCWVQLEEIDLAKYTKKSKEVDLGKKTDEIPKKKGGSRVCFYCSKRYINLRQHIKFHHKEAIKCGIKGCTTYFHTQKEKEQHMQQVSHEKRSKPREKREIRCAFCENFTSFSSEQRWRRHMKRDHPELPVMCARKGCKEFFKCKSEMILHINSFHKKAVNQDLYQCKNCEYYTRLKGDLKIHEEAKHNPKIFKCDGCGAKYGSKILVNNHYIRVHTFDKCKSCDQDVAVGCTRNHRKPSICLKCKLSFECLGLNQLHWKKCKQTPLTCKECGKTFTANLRLNWHVNKVHTKSVIFRCDHCDQIIYDRNQMMAHMQRNHFPKTFKCDECDKSYPSKSFLKVHKQNLHENVRCGECAQEMCRDIMRRHRTSKICRKCKCKLKCSGLLRKHKKSCEEFAPFICKECGKVFNVRMVLNRHVKQVHNKGVISRCDQCEFSTFNKSLMERHIQIVHLP